MTARMILYAAFTLAISACTTPAPDQIPVPQSNAWRNIETRSTPHQLRGDHMPDEAFRIDGLIYRGGIRLTSDDPSFGGFSGIDVSPDGAHILALSDRSWWLAADLQYAADGRLTGVANARMAVLTGKDGTPLPDFEADAESIFGDRENLYVSFERFNRIDLYRPGADGAISYQKNAVKFDDAVIPNNLGVEAITPLENGKILAFSEAAPAEGGYIAWIADRSTGALAEVTYQPMSEFHPTDAKTLPDGDVVVVERAFSKLKGVRARVVRLASSNIEPSAVLSGDQLARFGPHYAVDNMEGLAIRTTRDGRTFIYLISDDNYNQAQQKTIVLMFELTG